MEWLLTLRSKSSFAKEVLMRNVHIKVILAEFKDCWKIFLDKTIELIVNLPIYSNTIVRF